VLVPLWRIFLMSIKCIGIRSSQCYTVIKSGYLIICASRYVISFNR
jgi:hypothetical protein